MLKTFSIILLALLIAIGIGISYFRPGILDFTRYKLTPIAEDSIHNVPLDPKSPWPKFRGNALQNGRSNVNGKNKAATAHLKPWIFVTGKGIFSSPVVDEEGTAYVGSADHYFYAIKADGTLKWRVLTEEIIDSAGLLDDRGRIYFGSGDGYVYGVNRHNGEVLWQHRAHSPAEVEKLHDIKLYNVGWFEGNVAILADGTLVAGNDNYLYYFLSRNNGEEKRHLVSNEMGWSLPAINTATNRLFFGSTFIALTNLKAFDASSGENLWTTGALGSISASPLLTSSDPLGGLIVGGFDGYVRAFAQKSGKELWSFATRDHIYASSAQLADGTIVTPSTDGTVYALDPQNGHLRWTFDTFNLGPIRSSPAVDGEGRIYFGGGDGYLYALNSDGSLRYAFLCNSDERSDLNSSPALGHTGTYIGGENGGVCFVPYDYCLNKTGQSDSRCRLETAKTAQEGLRAEGVHVSFTTPFGEILERPKSIIDANEPLAFTISLRKDKKSEIALIDKDSLTVEWSSDTKASVNLSANRSFITIVPQTPWMGIVGGKLSLTIAGKYRINPWRLGLKSFFGQEAGEFKQIFDFHIKSRPEKMTAMPYAVPKKLSDPATTFVISRVAAPNPSMLPSLNQIGFDSIHYLGGIVEGDDNKAVVYLVGARHDGKSGKTLVDPKSNVRFAMQLTWDEGLVTLTNKRPFTLRFNSSWGMPFLHYRLATRADKFGTIENPASLAATVNCDDIASYGFFLKLLGLSEIDSGQMHIYGAANMAVWHDRKATSAMPLAHQVGQVHLSLNKHELKATVLDGTINKNHHALGLLLVDAKSGAPLSLNYENNTTVVSNAEGIVMEVVFKIDEKDTINKPVRAYYLIDAYPVAKADF